MAKNPIYKISNQCKSIYKVQSEFCSISDHRNLFKASPLKNLINSQIIGSIFFNKIFVFFFIKNQFILFQVLKTGEEIILNLSISEKKNKILYFTKKNNVYVFFCRKGPLLSKKKKFKKFRKIIHLIDYKKEKGEISSSGFDSIENFFFLSFRNGDIDIINFKGVSKFTLNLTQTFVIKKIFLTNWKKVKIFIETDENDLSIINFFGDGKIELEKIKKILILHEYAIFFKKKKYELRCLYHKKKLKIQPNLFPGNKIISLKNIFFLLFSGKKYSKYLDFSIYKTYFSFYSLGNSFLENIYKFYLDFIEFKSTKLTFSFSNPYQKNSFHFCKSLNEKYKILIDFKYFKSRNDDIYDIKFFGKKNYFIQSSRNNSIEILTRGDFIFKKNFSFQNSSFSNIEIEGVILLALDQEGKIIFWNLHTLQILFNIKSVINCSNVFSFFGIRNFKGFLVIGDAFGRIFTWKIILKKTIILKKYKSISSGTKKLKILSIGFSKDRNIIAISFANQKVFLWKIVEKIFYLCLGNFKRSVLSLDFSPNFNGLICGTKDGFILNFDYLNGKFVKKFESENIPILCCRYNQDGKLIFGSFSDGRIKIWNAETGSCLNILSYHVHPVWYFDFSKRSKTIISGCLGGKLVIFGDFGTKISLLKKKKVKLFLDFQKIFSKNSLKIISSFFFPKIIKLYDSVLLYDFSFFLFNNVGIIKKKTFFSFLEKIGRNEKRFFLTSLILWNSKKSNLLLTQFFIDHILNIPSWLLFLKNELFLLNKLVNSQEKNFFEIKKLLNF